MLPSLAANLPGFSGSSAAQSSGGSIGAFNFNPGAAGNQLLIAIAAGVIVALLLRR